MKNPALIMGIFIAFAVLDAGFLAFASLSEFQQMAFIIMAQANIGCAAVILALTPQKHGGDHDA